MFTKIEDFLAAWQQESASTLKVMENLTDSSLNRKVTEEGRSLGFIAWHITQTIGEMMSQAGLSFEDFEESAPAPSRAVEINNEYQRLAQLLVEEIKQRWQDNMLDDPLKMYGQDWRRKDVLMVLLAHQSHHRGQMTVLMRQAGLKVPGVCGPSREEWSAFGMPEQP